MLDYLNHFKRLNCESAAVNRRTSGGKTKRNAKSGATQKSSIANAKLGSREVLTFDSLTN